MRQEHAGALLVILSAICYGFMAIFVKFAYAGQVNTITVLSVRFVLASLILWALVLIGRKAAAISLKELASLVLLSFLGYGAASTLLFASLQIISASLASLILFIHPVMVTVYEVIFYRYPLSFKKIAALVLSTAGLILVMGNISGGANFQGILMVLGAALSYSAYLLYGKKVLGRHSPVVATAYVLSSAAVGFTAFGLLSRGINFSFPPSSWIWIIAVAVISTSMGILFLFAGLRRLEAGKASVISTFEVVITVFFSSVLLGDVMSPLQVAGGLMILTGIFIARAQPGPDSARPDKKTAST